MTSTGKSLKRIERLRRALGAADAVVVGADIADVLERLTEAQQGGG